MRNIPPQFARTRPTKWRTIASITATAPLLPGEGVKFTFAATVSAFQQIFFPPNLIPRFLSVKTSADVHFAFGPATMAVDNGDELLQPGDSYQDFATLPGDLGFNVKGDTVGGDFYVLLSSQ